MDSKYRKERKVKLLKAIQAGFLKPEELAEGGIVLIKMSDGKFKRKHGKVMTPEEVETLKQKIGVIELEMTYDNELHLLWMSFEELMIQASQI